MSLIDGAHTCTLNARTKANASPKHPNIQSSVVSRWRYTYNKISTLLQAELVLQNAAASHYFFTYLDFSTNVQELLSKPLLQKHYFGGIHLTIVHHIYLIS